jgi:hypothetical protein
MQCPRWQAILVEPLPPSAEAHPEEMADVPDLLLVTFAVALAASALVAALFNRPIKKILIVFQRELAPRGSATFLHDLVVFPGMSLGAEIYYARTRDEAPYSTQIAVLEFIRPSLNVKVWRMLWSPVCPFSKHMWLCEA